MALFGLYTSKREKEAIQQKKVDQLKENQHRLGQELRSALELAAFQNTDYKTFKDGNISQNIGRLKINAIPENGNDYSLLVRIENSEVGGPRFYDIWQIDINTPKDELHVFRCPYGPDSYAPLSSFEAKKQEISDLVRNYRLFR